jgi:hypothetical protein
MESRGDFLNPRRPILQQFGLFWDRLGDGLFGFVVVGLGGGGVAVTVTQTVSVRGHGRLDDNNFGQLDRLRRNHHLCDRRAGAFSWPNGGDAEIEVVFGPFRETGILAPRVTARIQRCVQGGCCPPTPSRTT